MGWDDSDDPTGQVAVRREDRVGQVPLARWSAVGREGLVAALDIDAQFSGRRGVRRPRQFEGLRQGIMLRPAAGAVFEPASDPAVTPPHGFRPPAATQRPGLVPRGGRPPTLATPRGTPWRAGCRWHIPCAQSGQGRLRPRHATRPGARQGGRSRPCRGRRPPGR